MNPTILHTSCPECGFVDDYQDDRKFICKRCGEYFTEDELIEHIREKASAQFTKRATADLSQETQD